MAGGPRYHARQFFLVTPNRTANRTYTNNATNGIVFGSTACPLSDFPYSLFPDSSAIA